MVITKHFLADKLGIDFEIAQFFADRKVPANNLYWKNKFLYVTYGTGYLFLPIIYDMLYKSGMDKKKLLEENRIQNMEKAFHFVAAFEAKQINFEDYIYQFQLLFRESAVHKKFFDDLIRYFRNETCQYYSLGTSIEALNRADAFLFTICDLEMEEIAFRNLLLRWYHTAASILILDDMVDWEDDKAHEEENAIIELGNDKQAIIRVKSILENNLVAIQAFNSTLAGFLQKIYDKALQDEPIKGILESQE